MASSRGSLRLDAMVRNCGVYIALSGEELVPAPSDLVLHFPGIGSLPTL